MFFLGLTSSVLAQQEIELADKFTGKIADPALLSARPESGIVQEQESWKKLWTAWRPNEPIKDVDFNHQTVLVETVPGPNLVFSSLLKLDGQGDLKYEIASSRIEGPGFGYLLMVVPKTGIRSFNGKTMDGKPVETRPVAAMDKAIPDSQPGVSPPVSVKPALEPNPTVGPPGVDLKTAGQEFVKVEIVGRVRAQFQSVGAETTGTLVAADGIVWELDLQQDEHLLKAARSLGDSLARINGKLEMQRQRGGIEARVRWIVHVESLEPLGVPTAFPPAALPTERPITQLRNAEPLAENPRLSPIRTVPGDAGKTTPRQPDPSTPPPVPESGMRDVPTSFKRLSIVTSDGQTQLIDSDGSIHYESKPRNLTNDWTTDPSSIAKLHQFVAETAWDQVPRKTRSESNDPNEINYTISIETSRGVTRFFIDRTAVPDQPTMKQFFEIIGEMARNR